MKGWEFFSLKACHGTLYIYYPILPADGPDVVGHVLVVIVAKSKGKSARILRPPTPEETGRTLPRDKKL